MLTVMSPSSELMRFSYFWKIICVIDNKAYKLDIPQDLKNTGLTLIFHSWKLHLALSNPYLGQVQEPQPAIMITESDNNEAHEE